MERLQGPINPCFFDEQLDEDCLEVQGLTSTGSLRIEEETLENNRMPFLQMLQSVEMESTSSFLPLKDHHQPSFQTLLRFQHLKRQQQLNQPWEEEEQEQGLSHHYNIMNNINFMHCEMETQIQAVEFESCVTHDNLNNNNIVVELHDDSPTKSEPNKDVQYLQYPQISSLECKQDQEQPSSNEQTHNSKSLPVPRERRKRKRTRPTKNKEEVETQRMTHIAVERNRRRQMNDHLNVLRSLMPASYIQRGDQASIVGGAIDFVKELEQLLHSLEARKRMRKLADQETYAASSSSSSSCSTATIPSSSSSSSSNGLFMSISQHRIGLEEDTKNNNNSSSNNNNSVGEEVRAENKSEAAEIEVTVIQTHVNLKIQCPRRPSQLLKAIVALEDLRLSILHLNITSSQSTVLYSFNLKIEDGCELGTADEIAGAVHQIFRFIDGS